MAKSTLEATVHCPHCTKDHDIAVEFDLPPSDRALLVPSEPVTVPGRAHNKEEEPAVISSLTGLLEVAVAKQDQLEKELSDSETTAYNWEHAPVSFGMANLLKHWAGCPDCSQALGEYLTAQQQELVKGLKKEQVMEIAKGQGWWPPKSLEVELPNGIGARKLR